MFAVNVAEAKQVIRDVAIRLNEPVFMWGQPGGGKSSIVEQLADELDAVLCDIRLSMYDSVDLRGIPTADAGATVWNLPATLPFVGNDNFPDDKLIILFFDEITGGNNPGVQAPCYQIINDRRCGEHVLKPNVRIVAASNRDGDRGVQSRMALPLANRGTHIELITDVDASCEYAQISGWPMEWVAFIQFRKPLLSTFDPAKPDKTFATPRTWDKAMKYYADTTMTHRTKQIAMAGAVGDGAAAEFWGFVDVWAKVKDYMPRILKDPETVELPDEPSMTYAITVAVSGSLDNKNVSTYHKFLCRLDPEFTVLAWQLAVKRDDKLFATKEFIDFSKRFKVVFD